jgi:vanillate monooxygenase ferredoxin subunit
LTRQVAIKRLWVETPEIRCFELKAQDGQRLPTVTPGAHIDVHLPQGLIRQYSLWNGPEDKETYFIGVKREPASRGGSAGMHALAEGELLTISEPKNNFELVRTSRQSLLLAAGIGITPLLSMARHLKAEGLEARLHLFSRSETHSPFADVLKNKLGAEIHVGLMPPDVDQVIERVLRSMADGAHLYICGPGPFMSLVRASAAKTRWPESNIHLEYFSAKPASSAAEDEPFEVVLHKSGRTISVKADQTIIRAMEEAGVSILTSCEQGVCGTCVTNVVEGEPYHRDQYFNATERASGKLITPCVSRCKGKRLVLDL